MKNKIVAITILGLFILSSFGNLLVTSQETTNTNNMDVYNIHIYGNDDFTEENGVSSGSGTENDPYIFENLDYIRMMHIKDTTAYFIMRNCIINDHIMDLKNVKNAEFIDCEFETGFFSKDLEDSILKNCVIYGGHDFCYNSLILLGCKNNYFESNEIKTGIYNSHSSDYNIFDSCNIQSPIDSSVYISNSCNNEINNCKIHNSAVGIWFNGLSNYNKIINCDIFDNRLGIDAYNGNQNIIYHNNIYQNEFNVERAHYDTGDFYWNNDECVGNYWDDYLGFDSDNDEIGDTPYDILASYQHQPTDEKDNYPRMYAYDVDSIEPMKPTLLGPSSGKKGVEQSFIVSSFDSDGDDVKFCIDWDGDGEIDEVNSYNESGEMIEIMHTWNKRGNYKVQVYAKDPYGYTSEWSDPLTINIPRARTINILFLKILEKFPILQRLINL